ncbi:Cof-type HAD-IIB family hydrolase [Anditalea andensis]|uniref:Haloacid dehalogenase n=1 Tax=Anditalea andensis TaxID=1048983 RepID=A0A074KS74_9BACT|nr:Cof-type HAD-IIB family hydrolase [Anditalea andensis]KEO72806.1 haloacid dehalogenase [Anditalea andensis]
MTIKAICTDIDGTLLNKDRELSPTTIQTINRLPKDFPIILASSRMPSAMRHLQQSLKRLENPLICYNGGFVIDYQSEELIPIDNVSIPLEICCKIYELTRFTSIHLSLYSKDEWYAPQMDYWTEREIRSTKVQPKIRDFSSVMELWNNAAAGAHKVMCMGKAEEIEALFLEMQNVFSDDLHLYRSKDTYIEIAPRKISKASALKALLDSRYDIQMHEVMAFGDNYNDIELLKAVGLGVAVGNAREEVKAIADEITHSSIDDGVAFMINKYCLS